MRDGERGLAERLRDVGGDLGAGDAGGIAADRAVGEGDGHLPTCSDARSLIVSLLWVRRLRHARVSGNLAPKPRPRRLSSRWRWRRPAACYETPHGHTRRSTCPTAAASPTAAARGAGPGVVFLGGFRSDMTGTKAQFLEAWARARGQAYLRFDYTGHGASSGDFSSGGIGDWARDARDAVLRADRGAAGPGRLQHGRLDRAAPRRPDAGADRRARRHRRRARLHRGRHVGRARRRRSAAG